MCTSKYENDPNYIKVEGVWYFKRPNHEREEGYDLVPVK